MVALGRPSSSVRRVEPGSVLYLALEGLRIRLRSDTRSPCRPWAIRDDGTEAGSRYAGPLPYSIGRRRDRRIVPYVLASIAWQYRLRASVVAIDLIGSTQRQFRHGDRRYAPAPLTSRKTLVQNLLGSRAARLALPY